MNVTIDGQNLFDRQQLKIETNSFSRDSIAKSVPGLDGVLNIDMGGRGRTIKQTGTLRAPSRPKLNERIDAISAFMDGVTHTLKDLSGREYENIRMDSFSVNNERISGSGIVIDYEIKYTQLKAQQ
jgi:hypothetical protein